MFIEVKVKVSRIVDTKTRKRVETYLVDKDFFSEAEYTVTQVLNEEVNDGTVSEFDIQSIRLSNIREIYAGYTGEFSYVVTLKDIWLDDDGTEKNLKYKVLLWANDLTQANQRALALSEEGYNMIVEGIKQIDYHYLQVSYNAVTNEESEGQQS